MALFQHHPDGLITIDDFTEPLADFLIDEPGYILPANRIGRIYMPGKTHHSSDGANQHGEEFPWPAGDVYLSKKAIYRAAQAVRHPAPPPPTADNTRRDALFVRIDEALADAATPARLKNVLTALRTYAS